jgi:hypothetical protein
MNRNHETGAGAGQSPTRTTLLDLIMKISSSAASDESAIVANVETAIRSRSVSLCGIYAGCEDRWAANLG